MPPETVATLLARVRRRRMQLDVAIAFAWGFVTFAIGDAVGGAALGVTAGLAVAATIVGVLRGRWTLARAAAAIERAQPACRNMVITAEELQRHPERASPRIAHRVAHDASRAAKDVRVGHAVPSARLLALCAVAFAVGAAVLVVSGYPAASLRFDDVARSTVNTILRRSDDRLRVKITPPAYAKIEASTVVNPERINALEGSQLVFSSADPVALRFGTQSIGSLKPGSTLQFIARESGYFAVDSADGGQGRRLIALSVRADAAPTVKIDQPAKDLLLTHADRSIPLKITAADDLALASLELRYVRVSGSGESFEFKEGVLPMRLFRGSSREWRADAEISLSTLKLEPGESLVYRAVARDGRLGEAGIGTSDTFYVEIAGPGKIALEGVEMPPQEERYALSQQMIVLKIERLRARQASMAREAVVEETALLAAEQRTVRANFVFLLGGHVEDEEVEAEQSHEIAEGRLENTARRDINRAIGDMTRAEQGLVAGDPAEALPPARAAVASLQRAFGRARYLLRTLPVRSRIDPSRRLTGPLSAAAPWSRRPGETAARQGEEARRLLADLYLFAERLESGKALDPQAVDEMAERALGVDPASAVWQEVSRDITALRSRPSKPVLDRVIPRIAAEAAKGLIAQTPLARPKSTLERAWDRGIR